MKKIKKTGLLVILLAFSILTIGIVSEASFIKNDQNKESTHEEKSDNIIQQQLFDADLTFYLWEGEGCGCDPIVNASIFAVGGEGNDSGFTDEDGKCVLTLFINSEYRVEIQAEKFHRILFDIEVIGDQTFNFHMKKEVKPRFNSQPLKNIFITKLLKYILL